MCPPMTAHLAPPGEYDWTCASFGPLESTTITANGSVQPFLYSLRQKVPILYNRRHYPPELPLQMGDLEPHVTHDALGPCEPSNQTAPRSVQPCLHRWPRRLSVPILLLRVVCVWLRNQALSRVKMYIIILQHNITAKGSNTATAITATI